MQYQARADSQNEGWNSNQNESCLPAGRKDGAPPIGNYRRKAHALKCRAREARYGRARRETAISASVSAAGTAAVSERSEEQTSELQSLMRISYDVFCLNKTSNMWTCITPTKPSNRSTQ